jgi:hypothetical protein
MVRLETDEVAECVTAMFRSPIAPDNTSNAKATTVRHLYIDPPNRKLTRGGSYVILLRNGTEMLLCV